jgi:hypothetical protein
MPHKVEAKFALYNARRNRCLLGPSHFSHHDEENCTVKLVRISNLAILLCLPFVSTLNSGYAQQDQHPILDKIAAKIVQKYQKTPCAQLKAEKAAKTQPTPQEQKAVAFLKSDPQLRTIFINKIAAPIANKMF